MAENRVTVTIDGEDQLSGMVGGIASGMNGMGRSLSNNLTAPIMGFGAGVADITADFESSMNKVQVLSRSTGSEFESLEAMALQLGASTEFTAVNAADAMAFFGSAGYDAASILGAITPTLHLASATGTDLADTAGMISTSFQAAGVPIEDFGAKAEAMGAIFSRSNMGTDLSLLGTQLSRVAGTATNAGLDITETIAAIGVLGNAGQLRSAGTNLGNIFKAFGDATKSQMLSELGVQVADSSGNFREFGDVLTDLKVATDSMTEQDRASALSEIFGVQGGRGIQALLSDVEGYKELVESGFSAEAGGGLEQMRETMQSGLKGAIVELGSAWEGFQISIGQSGFTRILEIGADALTKVLGVLTQLPGPVVAFGIGLAAAAAAIGPILMGVAALGFIGPMLSAGFAMLAPAVLPVLAIGAALLALGAVIWRFRAQLTALFAGIGAGFKAYMGPLSAAFQNWWGTIQPVVSKFREALSNLFGGNTDGVATFASIGQLIGSGLAIALTHMLNFAAAMAPVVGAIAQVGMAITNAMLTPFRMIGAVLSTAGTFIGAFVASFSAGLAPIGPVVAQIGMAFSALWGAISQLVGVFGQVGSAALNLATAVFPFLGPVISMVSGVMGGLVGRMTAFLSPTAQAGSLAQQLGAMLGGALAAGANFVMGAISALTGVVRGLASALGSVASFASNAISSLRNMASAAASIRMPSIPGLGGGGGAGGGAIGAAATGFFPSSGIGGMIEAAISESRNAPSGSQLMVANSSEAILNENQQGGLVGALMSRFGGQGGGGIAISLLSRLGGQDEGGSGIASALLSRAVAATSGGGSGVGGGGTFAPQITVNAQPGMDVNALAAEVLRRIESEFANYQAGFLA